MLGLGDSMRLSCTNEHGTVTIENDKTMVTLNEFLDDVECLLRGLGYAIEHDTLQVEE